MNNLGIEREETEAYALRVVEDAYELEEYIEKLIDNTVDGITPDLFSHFSLLEGFESEEFSVMKSYGLSRPSLLRIYAIEVDKKCHIIFYSGIKIAHSIGDSPGLKDNVITRARQVIDFLKQEGIMTISDVEEVAN